MSACEKGQQGEPALSLLGRMPCRRVAPNVTNYSEAARAEAVWTQTHGAWGAMTHVTRHEGASACGFPGCQAI